MGFSIHIFEVEEFLLPLCHQQLFLFGSYLISFVKSSNIDSMTAYKWNFLLNLMIITATIQVLAPTLGWLYWTLLLARVLQLAATYTIMIFLTVQLQSTASLSLMLCLPAIRSMHQGWDEKD